MNKTDARSEIKRRFSILNHSEKEKETKTSDGEISHFQALTTALSATVGMGNIAGVAVAISIGGPGAAFWLF